MLPRIALFATIALTIPSVAWGQAPPPAAPPKQPVIVPPPAKPPPPPGGKKVDAEFDPDAKPAEPPPLPPVQPGQWGVGGKEEEGRFAPPAKKSKEEEERKKKEEEAAKKPLPLPPPRDVWIDTVVGFGTVRDVTNETGGTDNGRTRTTGASFVFGFSWRFGDTWAIQARMPFIRASVNGPAGPFNTFAIGNLELAAKPTFQLTRRLRLPAQVAIYLPIAQGDYFPDPTASDKKVPVAQAQLNQVASYARGWEEMPLFASKRFGIRLGAGVVYTRETSEATASENPALAGGLTLAAGANLDLMLKTGGGDAYTGFVASSPSVAVTTYASAHWAFFDGKLEPGLRAWLTAASLPVYVGTKEFVGRDDSGPQFVIEPQINGRFPVVKDKSMAVKAGIGFILPVSGTLGGGHAPLDASIKGFRIHAGFQF
jgi:hypothetical protein